MFFFRPNNLVTIINPHGTLTKYPGSESEEKALICPKYYGSNTQLEKVQQHINDMNPYARNILVIQILFNTVYYQ